MGDIFGEGFSDEKPVHEVCVDSFYMSRYEITQGEYKKLIDFKPSPLSSEDRYPMFQMSWTDAQNYIKALNDKSDRNYRLPTEAEWEYAARSGGKKEKYAGSNSPARVAWYRLNSARKPVLHTVGLKSPNGLGLYDMSGNVWEWCNDWYGKKYYESSSRDNPTGPRTGSERVVRGGGTDSYFPWDVRLSLRGHIHPNSRRSGFGFRLVLPGYSH